MDTDRFIVCLKAEGIQVGIARDVEMKSDT